MPQDHRQMTDRLISRLALECTPVTPLAHPLRRAGVWALVALGFAAAMVWAISPRPDLAERLSDSRFLLEQGAAIATALAAAIAALALTIPGTSRWLHWLPLAPGLFWASTLTLGCWRDWVAMGAQGLRLSPDLQCFFLIALIGSLPAVVLVLMLRKGVPLAPRTTLALAMLASAGIGTFALRFFHMQDAALMVLVWQVGSVLLLSAIAAASGKLVLRRSALVD